jgi:hypothetical protein
MNKAAVVPRAGLAPYPKQMEVQLDPANAKPTPAAPKPITGRHPTTKDLVYSVNGGGGCSSQLLSNWALAGWTNGYGGEKADWSLPLADDFIEEVKERFNTKCRSWGHAFVLMTVTPVVNSTTKAYRHAAYDHFVVVEHILERTGWIRGACGMGQHGYPVQVWSRPSDGVQLDYKKEQEK